MTKNNSKFVITIKLLVLIGAALLLVGAILLAYRHNTNARDKKELQQTNAPLKTTNNTELKEEYTPTQKVNIEKAKTVASSYMQAVADCEYAKANSYRFIPSRNSDLPQGECIGRCKDQGYEYSFNKFLNYDDTQLDDNGQASIVVTFSYGLRCTGADRSSPIEILVSNSEDRWLIVQATGPADVDDNF